MSAASETRLANGRWAPAVAACALLFIACWDDARDPLSPADTELTQDVVVSNAVGGAASSMRGTALLLTDTGVTYVSLAAGRFPTGVLASIRNRRSGWSATAAMIDGGLDPVEVVAQVGDTIEIGVKKAGEASLESLFSPVPAKRRPRVVRTIPARRKTDVPLNARISIVFSEPMDPSTVNPSTVRLVAGTSSVPGVVMAGDSAGLRFEFVPTSGFVANTRHVIALGSSISDLDGDLIELGDEIEFTTGNAVAIASVVTEAAAIFTVADRGPRTFTMNAVRYGDGRVAGDFLIYYADLDRRRTGRITCLTILGAPVGGTSAWIAGVSERVNGEPDPDGLEWGWRAVDNHQTANVSVPADQLSLAQSLEPGLFENAPAFCASTPLSYPNNLGDFRVFNLESGDIVIRGETPPDSQPPRPNAMSQIAFQAPQYGIRLMTADGSSLRPLTTNTSDMDPAWSPDGRRIAFARGGASVYTINVDRTGETRRTNGASDRFPAWSPDGQRIAFARQSDGIHVLNLQDGSITRVTDGVVDSRPTWSPDGSRIAFARYRDLYNADGTRKDDFGIFVANLPDGSLTRLTHDTLVASSPAWSPDGTRIALVVADCDPPNDCVQVIHVINTDGTGLRRVSLGRNPAWSPDSRRLVFDDIGISLINADGSGRMRKGNGLTPAWSVGTMPPAPDPTLTIELAGGDAQSDTVLSTLAQPLRVRVRDSNGSPVSGIRVDWFGPGTLSPRASTTDASGVASTTMTLTSGAGVKQVRALVLDGTALSDGVEFTILSRPGNPVTLSTWMPDTVLAVTDATMELHAFAFDGHGNYVAGVPVTWAMTSGAGSVAAMMDTTAYEPLNRTIAPYVAWARASLAIGPNEGQRVITIAAPTLPGSPQRSVVARGVTKVVGVYWGGFDPSSVEVPAGRTVAWEWWGSGDSDDVHNVTFEDDPTRQVSSATLQYGRHFRTFTGAPRTIRYRCTLHTTSFVTGDEIGVVVVK